MSIKPKFLALGIIAFIALAAFTLPTVIEKKGDPQQTEATPVVATPAATPIDKVTPIAAAVSELKHPGFEAAFAIAGLLAVSFLVLRQRK